MFKFRNLPSAQERKSGKKSVWGDDQPTAAEWAVWKLPPGTRWQSWCPVVRLELKAWSGVSKVTKNIRPVCCMVQTVEWEEEFLIAWNLDLAKLCLNDDVMDLVERHSKGVHAFESVKV